MASNSTIAHRFANKDYNFERGLQGSNTHISGKNYYSYNTVFGQWVDEYLCLVYWGDTSISSHKHMLNSYDFPKGVTLLPYDDGGRNSYTWHGCDLLGYKDKFTFEHRAKLIDFYVGTIFDAISNIRGGKKKNLDSDAQKITNRYWHYVMILCTMYRDTTISKWLRIKRGSEKVWTLKKKLVRELDAQNLDVTKLADILFGEGTYKAYYDYCARYRKAANKREQMAALCNRLGIKNPYESYGGKYVLEHNMSADDIRKMNARQRNEWHFLSIMHKEWDMGEKERFVKRLRNSRNAYKWITGYEPKKSNSWSDSWSDSVDFVRNMYTGEEYIVSEQGYRSHTRLWGIDLDIEFNYEHFRKTEDKEAWIRNFYERCELVHRNLSALQIFDRYGDAVYTDQPIGYSTYRVYVINDVLRHHTTEEELKICEDFVERWNTILRDKEARHRAEQLAILQREEEERKEKELQEQIRQEQIDACLERGVEGYRDLWRLHYKPIWAAEQEALNTKIFYHNGNVLLRFSMNKDKVESSKHIRFTIATAKAVWKLVSKWHEHPETFKEMTIKTLDGTYTISSYYNDILTAGCHDIAYAEMEHMWNEIVKLENEAA